MESGDFYNIRFNKRGKWDRGIRLRGMWVLALKFHIIPVLQGGRDTVREYPLSLLWEAKCILLPSGVSPSLQNRNIVMHSRSSSLTIRQIKVLFS